MDATVIVGKQGRLVIPVELRAELGLAAGDRLHVTVKGREIVMRLQADAIAELQRLGDSVPRTRSLVDELLAERRLAAASE